MVPSAEQTEQSSHRSKGMVAHWLEGWTPLSVPLIPASTWRGAGRRLAGAALSVSLSPDILPEAHGVA